MASERCSVLVPVPLRKMERQTRVSRRSSKYCVTVLAIFKPSQTATGECRWTGPP